MFDKIKFKHLLEMAIGDYTITEFANLSDVNRTYLSKLLNLNLDKAPSPKIIRKIALKAKNNVTYENLMEAAGHISKMDVVFGEDASPDFIKVIGEPFKNNLREKYIKIVTEEFDIDEITAEKTFDMLTYDDIYNGIKFCDDAEIKETVVDTIFKTESQYEISIGDVVKIPVLGKIPAGLPVEAQENIIDYVDVPKIEVANGEYFYLQVIGDSMIGCRIYEGDRVLVRKQPDVENGEIAVVRVNGDEATLKRVKKINGQVILYPDNPNYDPIVINSKDAIIIGKVIKVEFEPNKK